jgi:hypothetical protein
MRSLFKKGTSDGNTGGGGYKGGTGTSQNGGGRN